MATTFADVAGSEFVLLTTFTRDGREKPTVVWAVQSGDALLVITGATSWKVKRVRNTPRVTIATCDRRGGSVGEAVEAKARLLDPSANAKTYALIGKRYGLLGKVLPLLSKLRFGNKDSITIELTA